jgi:hypothetical protein
VRGRSAARPRVFAQGTTVPVEKTRAEIERLLGHHGASQLGLMSDTERGIALVLFTVGGRQVRLRVPLPRLAEFAGEGRRDSAKDLQERRWEQASRERWRAVLLVCKAKLELVELGLSTVEREFLADIALPNGQTVGEFMRPQLAEAYDNGRMPPLLPGAGS